jgi:hypothetical protein
MASNIIRFLAWKASLLLVISGGVMGYLSFENWNIWGGGSIRYPGVWMVGFFIGAAIFLTGFISLAAIAIQLVASPTESAQIRSIKSTEKGVPQPLWPLQISRFSVSAIVVLASVSFWSLRGPEIGSAYGRSYWICALATLVLSQLPYVISLARAWSAPDRIGLGIGVVSSLGQLLWEFFPSLRYPGAPPDPWPWLSIAVCMVVFAFGLFALRTFSVLRENVGSLISIVFGFTAYTIVAQIAVAILRFRLRV